MEEKRKLFLQERFEERYDYNGGDRNDKDYKIKFKAFVSAVRRCEKQAGTKSI